MLNIGISTAYLSHLPTAEAAAIAAEGGFRCAELSVKHPDLSPATPETLAAAVEAFRSRGISVPALAFALREPEEDPTTSGIRWASLAAAAGIPHMTVDCKIFSPTRKHSGLCPATCEEDYRRLKEQLLALTLGVEKAGVRLHLTVSALDPIPSPRRLKLLIEEMEEETKVRLGAVLCAGNLIDNSDEEGIFYYLRNDVAFLRSVDRRFHSLSPCPFGEGDVDWVKLLECCLRFADKAPFFLVPTEGEDPILMKQRAEDYYDRAFKTILSRIS